MTAQPHDTAQPDDDLGYRDGNALAGALREVFAVDVTPALGRCAGCGQVGAVATLRVYDRAPGLVARCPGCDAVVLRLVRGRDRAWLDLRGSVSLEIPLPPT
ncbi:MAG TPA: DUF6510 family protein [Pilimelia sp.]|nr:DUF6510 family protein [Pilimelia sp.]